MKKIIAVILATLAIAFSGSNMRACDWSPLEKIGDQKKFEAAVAKQFKNAVAVFSGEVVELRQTTVKFKVEKVWKGDIKDEYAMSTGTRLVYGGAESSSCDYDFKFRGNYLVFAFKTKHDDVQTWLPSLTQNLADARRTIEVLNRGADDKSTDEPEND